MPFQKGKSGNPNGKPKGALNKSTIIAQSLLDGDAEALAGKAVENRIIISHQGIPLGNCGEEVCLRWRKRASFTFQLCTLTVKLYAAAGTVKRAPFWMQRVGLEWLYRPASQPTRLWKRYLVTNSIFLKHYLLQLISPGVRTAKEP